MPTDYDNASISDLIDDFVMQEITFDEVIKINKKVIYNIKNEDITSRIRWNTG